LSLWGKEGVYSPMTKNLPVKCECNEIGEDRATSHGE